jgi:hypothetical protein
MIKEIFFFCFPFLTPIKKIVSPQEKKIVVYDFLKTETVDQNLLLSTSQERPFLILHADQFEKIIHLLQKKRKKKKSKWAYGYYMAGGVTLIVVYKIVVATKWYVAFLEDLYNRYVFFKWLSDYKAYFFSYDEYFAQNPFSFFEYPDVEKKYQAFQASAEERFKEMQKAVVDTIVEEQNKIDESIAKHVQETHALNMQQVADLFVEQEKKIEGALDAQSQHLIVEQKKMTQEASSLLEKSLLEQCQAIGTLLVTITAQGKALDQKMSAESEVLLAAYTQIIEAQKKLEAQQQELVNSIFPENIEAKQKTIQKEEEHEEVVQEKEEAHKVAHVEASRAIDVEYLKRSFAYCVRTLVSLGVPDELIATIEQQKAQAGFQS